MAIFGIYSLDFWGVIVLYHTFVDLFFPSRAAPVFTEDIPDDVAIAPNRFLVDGGHGQIPEIQAIPKRNPSCNFSGATSMLVSGTVSSENSTSFSRMQLKVHDHSSVLMHLYIYNFSPI